MPRFSLRINKEKAKTSLITADPSESKTDLTVTDLLNRAPEQSPILVASQPDPTEGTYGLRILHDPASAIVDIVFVHGLTGNRENTWTRDARKKSACFWPQDLLTKPEHGIPNARISTWGYDAKITSKWPFGVVSENTIEQHAANLCTDLANIRDLGKMNRPLVFVVHSLGGLVVKTALLYASDHRTQNDNYISSIADSTHGILFMGTPHRGSDQAQWGGILASVLGSVKQANAELVRRLNKEEQQLEILHERFLQFLESQKERQQPISITCFWEELPVSVLGMIVPAASAKIPPYSAISIHANHTDMTKFLSKDDQGYIKVLTELQRWVEALTKTDMDETDAMEKDLSPSKAVNNKHTNIHHSGNVANGGVAYYGNSQTFSGGQFGGVHRYQGEPRRGGTS